MARSSPFPLTEIVIDNFQSNLYIITNSFFRCGAMVKQKRVKRICVFAFLFAFVCFFSFFCPTANAQPSQHVVQKGDTLSSICEKYYGDPGLWPKLWEMNPSITNPNVLTPGEVITLLEKGTVKKTVPSEKKPVKEVAKTEPVLKGIDFSDRIDMESIGYLSLVEVESLGRIDSAAGSKVVIGPGDQVFVDFGSRKDIAPGESFSIAETSDLIRHPITNKPLGYVVSVRGTLIVKKHVTNGTYLAKVDKTFAEVSIDDIVIPHQIIGSCIQPMPTDPKLYGNIVAIADNRQMVDKYSIVYLDGGFKDGIQTGCIFDVVSLHKTPMLQFNRYPLSEISKEVGDALGKATYLDDFTRELMEGKTLYEFSVGKLIVLEARPDTAIGIVIASREDLAPGEFVKGMPWVEPPDFLASLPVCLVK
jgi:hypothetical protein